MEKLDWRTFCVKVCTNCGTPSWDLEDTLCDECAHRLVLQVSADELKNYLDAKYAPPSDLKLNMQEVLEGLFPKDLFDYVTFTCLHFLLSSGLTELRAWQDRLGDLRLYAGKTPEEKQDLADKLSRIRPLLEDYTDKLQIALQELWKKAQNSPIKTKLEDFARAWQKSEELIKPPVSHAPPAPPVRPEFVEKVQTGLEEKLASIQDISAAIEKAFPALKSMLLELITQFQVNQNAQVSQALLRSLKELQFIMSLLPQMLQGRDYPRQTVDVYNINTLMDYGGETP